MNKQEAIKQAYGKTWNFIDDSVKNRILLNDGFTDEINESWLCNRFGIELELKDNYCRPKSLQGIENNNGWIKIEGENDLPKEFTECHFKIKKDSDIQVGAYVPHKNNFTGLDDDYFIMEISHYRPIEKPKPPIY